MMVKEIKLKPVKYKNHLIRFWRNPRGYVYGFYRDDNSRKLRSDIAPTKNEVLMKLKKNINRYG